VLLVSGAGAVYEFGRNGTVRELRTGDWLNIPPLMYRHRVDWTDETTFHRFGSRCFSPADPTSAVNRFDAATARVCTSHSREPRGGRWLPSTCIYTPERAGPTHPRPEKQGSGSRNNLRDRSAMVRPLMSGIAALA
jgi:hypothetical protein